MSRTSYTLMNYLRTVAGAWWDDPRDDAELLARFAEGGDEAAFKVLVCRYGPLVWRSCMHMLGDGTDAEDAFQTTFLTLAHKAGRLRQEPLGGWLHRVAWRTALNVRAAIQRRRNRDRQLRVVARPAMAEAGRVDLYAALDEELAGLPERLRAPLILCYLEGKKQEEIAHLLSCSRTAVRKRLARGEAILRERLERRGMGVGVVSVAALLRNTGVPAASAHLNLIKSTVQAAVAFRSGTFTGGVAVLTKGVLRNMFVAKLKLAIGAVVMMTILGGATGWIYLAAGQTESVEKKHDGEPATEREALGKGKELQTSAATRADSDRAASKTATAEKLPAGALARMGSGRLRHAAALFFASYLPDGTSLLTAGRDQTLRLWDLKTGQELRHFDCGKGKELDDEEAKDGEFFEPVDRTFKVALSRDGQLVAASRGGTVLVWETATGKKLHQLKTGQSDVVALAFAADRKSLATVGHDLTVILWDVATGKESKRLGNKAKPAVQPGGGKATTADKLLVALSPGLKYLAYEHDLIRVIDLESGKELEPIKTGIRFGGLRVLAFAPDGKTLAFAGASIPGAQQGEVKLWDVAAGKERTSLKLGLGLIDYLAFSPDSNILAAGRGENRTVKLCEIASGKELWQVGGASPPQYLSGQIRINGGPVVSSAMTFAPDGKTLVASLGSNSVRQFDVATGKEIAGHNNGHRVDVSVMALSADGKTLRTYSCGDPVYVWDAATGKKLRKVKLPADAADATFAADDKTFATSAGGTVTLWDTATGKELKKIDAEKYGVIMGLGLPPDGSVLATRGNLPHIHLKNTTTGKKLHTLTSPATEGEIILLTSAEGMRIDEQVVFSPDGRFLAGTGAKGRLCLWSVATGALIWEVAQPATKVLAERIVFSPDGRSLGALHPDGMVMLYETATGQNRARLGEPDKKRRICVHTTALGDGGHFSVIQSPAGSGSLAFSPDGRHVAAARGTAIIHVWDLLAGKECGQFEGHKGGIVSLAFSADGKRLFSGSMDTTVLSWDVGGLAKARPAEGNPLDAKTLGALWSDLASKDAEKAFAAIRQLSATPASAAYLGKCVRAAAAPEAKRVAKLIADLEDNAFEVRNKSEAELEALGDLVEPELCKALGNTSALDLRQKLQRLLQRLSHQVMDADQLRNLRAVEALEALATNEARQVLETLAKGAEGARLTRAAKSALERLAKR